MIDDRVQLRLSFSLIGRDADAEPVVDNPRIRRHVRCMPTAPSIITRILAWLVVVGLAFAGESFAQGAVGAGGEATDLQIRAVEGTIIKFVALESHPAPPPPSLQLIKVWGSVFRPAFTSAELRASLERDAVEPPQSGTGILQRATLVGIVELRI